MSQSLITVNEIAKSSRFRPAKYTVPFGNFELAGLYSSADFFNSLKIMNIEGDVAVIFCGNGGLNIEAVNRGASIGVGFETRDWLFHPDTFDQIRSAHKDKDKIRFYPTGLPHNLYDDPKSRNPEPICSIVIVAEGWQNFCKTPIQLLKGAWALVKEGGEFIVELEVRTDLAPSEPTNAWYPRLNVFHAFMTQHMGVKTIGSVKPGHLEGRFIYRISKPVVTMPPQDDEVEDFGKKLTEPLRVPEDFDEEPIVVIDEKDVEAARNSESGSPERKKVYKAVTKEIKAAKKKKIKKKDPAKVAAGKRGAETRKKNKAERDKKQE